LSLAYEECTEKTSVPVIEDLQGGMTFFYKVYRRLLCVRLISERGVAKNFVSEMFQINTKEQAKEIKEAEISPLTATYPFDDADFRDTNDDKFKAKFGY